jgi:phosphoribosylanthranilate isomerase
MTPVQIKICGVTNVEDAKACVELGAQMIGLNFDPQSPRYIERTVAGQIVQAIRPGVQAVGVFVDANADEVRDAASIAGIRSVQLHGNFSSEIGRELAREFRVIRAFSPMRKMSAERSQRSRRMPLTFAAVLRARRVRKIIVPLLVLLQLFEWPTQR